MRITMRHHFDFGADRTVVGDDLVTPGSWDALRTKTNGSFSLARSREELERAADARPEIEARARAIDGWLQGRDVGVLASYGVGAGVLEAWLLRLHPRRRLLLTDYAPETVAGLASLFPEAGVMSHDLLADPPLTADVHLFHRVDTELTDAEWHTTLRRFEHETVLMVAAEVATTRRLVQELLLRARSRQLSRAGWLRTRDAFVVLWTGTHDAEPLRLHDLQGWALAPHAT